MKVREEGVRTEPKTRRQAYETHHGRHLPCRRYCRIDCVEYAEDTRVVTLQLVCCATLGALECVARARRILLGRLDPL